jgi:hypothetical protein
MKQSITGVSWKPGCPLPLDDLRLVRVSFWGFDQNAHTGTLIVNYQISGKVEEVFRKLYEARFPIQTMQVVDRYGGSDDSSMAANNTSAFNCRPITGGGRFSYHAWGLAIDIDPVQNPYVKGDTVEPPMGKAFLDRSNVRPGMIVAGGVVSRAFSAVGAGWGGDFTGRKDYMHFEWPSLAH